MSPDRVAWAFLCVLAAMLCAWLWRAALRSRREMTTWLGVDPFGMRRAVRLSCFGAATLAMCTALWISGQRAPERVASGSDLVLAIDVSRSMGVTDAAPTRLRRAARLASRLIRDSPGLRVGLVLFAGDAYVALPLTLDRDAVLAYLGALDTELISSRGSDLGRALSRSAEVFDASSSRSRGLLLLSDGEHAGPAFDAALGRLRRLGVRMVTVGLGRRTGGTVPGTRGGPLRDEAGRPVLSARDDARLRSIAAATSGRYFRELEDRPSTAVLREALRAPADAAAGLSGAAQESWIVLALVLLCGEWLLALDPVPRLRRRRRASPPGGVATRVSSVLLAIALLGASDGDVLVEGDAHLARGAPEAALAAYQRAQRESGATSEILLRVGQALYQLEDYERAAAAYVETLRRLEPDASDLRFVASFNLGNTLVALERFDAAREAYWGAMLERPDDLEAKFNNEWVTDRSESEGGNEDGDPQDSRSSASDPTPGGPGAARAVPREGEAPPMDAEEAQRWLLSVDESLTEPLRRQLQRQAGAQAAPPPTGQSW